MEFSDYIDLDTAKNMIVTALEEFDPELGQRAADILFNEARLNIMEVTHPRTHMMQCRPAGMTLQDLEDVEMLIPDFGEYFGPAFTRQDNPENYAIIDFEYNGTPASIIWLSHELGHAIADDMQRENGLTFRDFHPDEMEEQAYFIQHITSHYIKKTFSHTDLNDEKLGEDPLKMSWERATSFLFANQSFMLAQKNTPDERKTIIENALGIGHPNL